MHRWWGTEEQERQENGKAVLDYWFSGPRFAWVMRWHSTKRRKFIRRGKTKHQRHVTAVRRRQA